MVDPGCLTCREKHVKCDERVPVCRRCERLKLSCSPYWTHKQRSRTATSSSLSPSLQVLLPKRQAMSSESEPRFQQDMTLLHMDADLLGWTRLDDFSCGIAPALLLDAVALSQSSLDVLETMPMWNHTEDAEIHASSGISSNSESRNVCVGPARDPPPILININPGPSSPPGLGRADDDGLVLGHEEHKALKHYQDGFCVVHTSKRAAWSFPILLLQKTSYSSIVMQCAMAVSLQDLAMRRNADGLVRSGRSCTLAYTHFKRAASAFREVMRQSVQPVDHVEVLATFYFHYVYLTHQETIDRAELQRLSRSVADYLETSSIAQILTDPDQDPSTATMLPSTRSFLCRLLLWVYREDVYAMGYRCAGEAAKYISNRPTVIRRLCVISQAALQLNCGTQYPTERRIDDVFSAPHLDMLVRWIQLQFDITQFAWSMAASESPAESTCSQASADAMAQIEKKMNRIDRDFAPTFQMITVPDDTYPTPTSDLVQSAAVFVTLYYAWKITYYQCAGVAQDKIQEVLALLMQSAQHTTLKIQLKELQRALLTALIETRDPIHREWILDKIGPSWGDVLRMALARHGQRVDIWTIYEVASDISGIQ
ncbi:hypothetical protein CC79DRAFT_1317279 [Sarocladium strictum]